MYFRKNIYIINNLNNFINNYFIYLIISCRTLKYFHWGVGIGDWGGGIGDWEIGRAHV